MLKTLQLPKKNEGQLGKNSEAQSPGNQDATPRLPKPKPGDRRYRFGSVEVLIKCHPVHLVAVSDTGVCRLPNRAKPHLRELEFRVMLHVKPIPFR